ncbi:MAG: hypothetical protein WBA17_10080, partial [Saprospiraceae bacterium]
MKILNSFIVIMIFLNFQSCVDDRHVEGEISKASVGNIGETTNSEECEIKYKGVTGPGPTFEEVAKLGEYFQFDAEKLMYVDEDLSTSGTKSYYLCIYKKDAYLYGFITLNSDGLGYAVPGIDEWESNKGETFIFKREINKHIAKTNCEIEARFVEYYNPSSARKIGEIHNSNFVVYFCYEG